MKIINSKIIDSFINSRQSSATIISLALNPEQAKYILKRLHKIGFSIPVKFNFGTKFKKNIHTKVIAEFSQIIYNVLHQKNFPIRELPSIFPKEFNKLEKRFQLIIYSYVPKAVLILSQLVIKIIQDKNSDSLKSFDKFYTEQFSKKLETIDGLSRLNKNFINSAYARDIPFIRFSKDIIQYGWGKNGFHLGGTFSENTPRNSVVTVRNKYLTSLILKKAGFPVIDEAMVKDHEECKKFAKRFGYPVVLKPSDKDAGQGIEADISNMKQLIKAFDRCLKISKNILIQRFIEGAHYRFTTVNGKVVWIYQIDSAFVLGDGESSLSILIKKENATPKRTFPYKNIPINETTVSLLKKQNLKLSSIPKKGEKIQLGIVQNVYEGAIPFVIPPDKVHSDNILLIERAAELFRLDITGIDCFISDISKPWYEGDSHILEINSCPDLNPSGPHIYDVILTQSVTGNGRIPSALIIKEKDQNINLNNFVSFSISNNKKVGIYTQNEIKINSATIFKKSKSDIDGFKTLLLDNSVDFLIMIVEKKTPFSFVSLPIDKFDCVCIETTFSTSDSNSLNWLPRAISFDFCKNKKIKNQIYVGSQKVKTTYKSLNNYLMENFPKFENLHKNKLQAIKDPLT